MTLEGASRRPQRAEEKEVIADSDEDYDWEWKGNGNYE